METQKPSIVEPAESKKSYKTYKLKIAVTKDGDILHGSKAIKENEGNISDLKEIYRSQEKYQVAVKSGKKWVLSTMRDIKKTSKNGRKLVKRFC